MSARARYPTRAISISLTGDGDGDGDDDDGRVDAATGKRVPRSYARRTTRMHIKRRAPARGHSQLTETNPRSCMHKVLSRWKIYENARNFSESISVRRPPCLSPPAL